MGQVGGPDYPRGLGLSPLPTLSKFCEHQTDMEVTAQSNGAPAGAPGATRPDEPVPFVDLRSQYEFLKHEIVPRVCLVFERAQFILGPEVAEFEKQFASYTGTAHCVGVESGTGALKLALEALGIGAGDEVIVPANTYIASALAVSATGAVPVLVDMADDYLIDVDLIERRITPRTKAILPVHLYGQTVAMNRVLEIAARHRLRVIEDAAQAHGAKWNGARAGSFGDVACFSFYPGKNLGAYGDGGAVVTNDPDVADQVRLLRDFGQKRKYEHLIKGDNCRLDSVQAAVLNVKLKYIDAWNDSRRNAASYYDELLPQIGITPPRRRSAESHVYHLYVIEVEERDAVREKLAEQGVESGIHYPIPIHLQPAYAELGYAPGSFPKTEASAKRLLSLPMFPEITRAQIERVVSALAAARRTELAS
jgi:dTDP-4-amino-4,6-dideoxygalactose transaminase